MKTLHRIEYRPAAPLAELADASVDLVVTSPPYPMIEMWDGDFARQNPDIGEALNHQDGRIAFELMHRELDKVWEALVRVLKPGGIACIDVGDATRTIGADFVLYPNHARVQSALLTLGLTALPGILWRKPTNAPNKFMGSGMLPPGAYVTLEHEVVLIFRKGGKRAFASAAEKAARRRSAFFWEERNAWFSDLWTDLTGASQTLLDARSGRRSASYPFELPYRLIQMFSIHGDTVLDPFSGRGTTMYAAMASGRSSVGYEIDAGLRDAVQAQSKNFVRFANARIERRLRDHLAFVENRAAKNAPCKHVNRHYRFPVVTRQETELLIRRLNAVENATGEGFVAHHAQSPQKAFVGLWNRGGQTAVETPPGDRGKPASKTGQIALFDGNETGRPPRRPSSTCIRKGND